MLKKLLSYIKNNDQAFLKIAAYCGYCDTAPIKNWIKRKSIPKHMEVRLKNLLNGDENVTISIE